MEVKSIVCDFGNLYKAMLKCKNSVMWKDSVAKYVNNALANTLRLHDSLWDGSYRISEYCKFTIYEPKKREIVSTGLKDRIFQRSLCDNYLYKAITNGFIYDNGACQIDQGTDFSINRLSCHLQRFFRKYGMDGYVLKCDIKDYFGSTRHEVAKAALTKRVKNEWALARAKDVVDSYSQKHNPGVGIGLGSQVSQLIQLAVLDDLDHYIKEQLKIKQYVRYMDDFMLIHPSKAYLKECLQQIAEELKKLRLALNIKKTQIFPLKQGISFLGFHFYLTETGKVIRVLNKENIKNRKRKLRKYKKLVTLGKMTREKADECYGSGMAYFRLGNSYGLLKKMDVYYNNLWR